MTVTINKSVAGGCTYAPPSKSMAHRYLICGAFSEKSVIKNIELSDDILVTIGCLKALGANVLVDGTTVTIGGLSSKNEPISNNLFCNESGSTLRFLLPVCLTFDKEITLTGSKRLFSRDLSVYEQLCKEKGFLFIKTDNSVTVKGRLECGKYSVRGDISSQFISGLIFALSTLDGESFIEITTNSESASYLSLTAKALSEFGVSVSWLDEHTLSVKGEKYKSQEIFVEGDYSNAAFLEAFNLFGGNVSVMGLLEESLQGDKIYKDYFKFLKNGTPTLDVSDCPDLAPVLMAVAAAKNGAKLVGTRRLKIKESDRGVAMKTELEKFGCYCEVLDNEIIVEGGNLTTPTTELFGHNDHRIVMSLAVLLSITGGKITGAEAVNKSFPNFFNDISRLGIDIEVQ